MTMHIERVCVCVWAHCSRSCCITWMHGSSPFHLVMAQLLRHSSSRGTSGSNKNHCINFGCACGPSVCRCMLFCELLCVFWIWCKGQRPIHVTHTLSSDLTLFILIKTQGNYSCGQQEKTMHELQPPTRLVLVGDRIMDRQLKVWSAIVFFCDFN